MSRLDRRGVKKYRLATFLIKCVRIQSRLDHDEGIADIFVVENMAMERGLIR